MNREEQLYETLVNGPVRACRVGIPKTSRNRIRRRLEGSGKLIRTERGWKLTHQGHREAYEKYGILPTAAPSNYFDLDPDFKLEPGDVRRIFPTLSQIFAILLGGVI